VSGTPGKTQTLNFYQVTAKFSETERPDFFLVDLPGYGYAKSGREAKQQWSKFIQEYITTSPRLKLVIQLIDSRHAPMASDLLSYQWLREHGRSVQIVATKADKLTNNQLQKQLTILKRDLESVTGIIAYSAIKGLGRDQLLAIIGRELVNEL
jgi:GTP-binding protein